LSVLFLLAIVLSVLFLLAIVLSVLFLLAIVLSVLFRLTHTDYLFDIFSIFLYDTKWCLFSITNLHDKHNLGKGRYNDNSCIDCAQVYR
jgi:hypothetical protein